jgi:DNA mismatch endonuclease (patch repair protein)
MDTVSKEKRSEIMSKIRGKNTKPELLVRKWLFHFGYRFRIHDERYPGTPDIILLRYKTAIFVHGCFWHNHQNCKIAHVPKSRSEYWEKKFYRNIERDRAKVKALEEMGWNVIIVWECELKNDLFGRLMTLLEEIRGHNYD